MTSPAPAPSTLDAPPPVADEPRTPSKRPLRRRLIPYFLVIPAIITLLIGMGYPVGWQILNSFREYGLAQQFGRPPAWVGLENYIGLLTGSEFWTVLIRSVVFMGVTALATMVLGIGLALLMKSIPTVPRICLQISLLLAWAMPIVAQMTVWNWLIDDRNGLVNYLLSLLPGVDFIGHDWLQNPLSFFAIASIIITWASVPFVALSVYAGLTQVSDEVVEAAQARRRTRPVDAAPHHPADYSPRACDPPAAADDLGPACVRADPVAPGLRRRGHPLRPARHVRVRARRGPGQVWCRGRRRDDRHDLHHRSVLVLRA
ncbi:carbohydrate ABC transporter permease [Demequina litorisediminis]|uniref:carbohydrate ABC transporter permease n=1 Tax=Demequina litorisediminis TaxID=1849022 RepID=UPI0024E0EE2B|nr:sugar ABC transporter permease [Demequina litorisediminis]